MDIEQLTTKEACIVEKLGIEQIHLENIPSSTRSKEKFSKIHKAPYSLGSPFALIPKKTSHPIPHIPLVLLVTPQLSIIQNASTLQSTTAMAGPHAPTKMERIIAARYGPLVLPVPLNTMPAGEYQKYMPKFSGIKRVTVEEHLESF